MFKKVLVTLFFVSLIFNYNLFASTDFSSHSNDDLAKLRGKCASEDREAFSEEWQKRIQNMSQKDLEKYEISKDAGYRNRQRKRDGSGRGRRLGKRNGSSRDRGFGKRDGSGGGRGRGRNRDND